MTALGRIRRLSLTGASLRLHRNTELRSNQSR